MICGRNVDSILVSFQLASKHPENMVELFNNLEKTADDSTCFEVLVKIDQEDVEMCRVMAEQARLRPFNVKCLVSPRGEGYAGLWCALNEVFTMTHPGAYFVCNINDEVWFKTQSWDSKLRKYIRLFPDDIFRLRTSQLKFRNYYDFWECGYAPENYAFYTRRWLEIVGDWNPCFGPDSSQQYIAYYLGYANYPDFHQFNRDVPILDIAWGGEGVSKGLSEEQQIRRIATNFRLWMRQVSHPMQEELFRRARLLQANIIRSEWPGCEIEIISDSLRKSVLLLDRPDGNVIGLLSYRLSRSRLFLANFKRTMRYTYYAGGGREAWNFLPFSIIEFILYYFPEIRFEYRRLLSSLKSIGFAGLRKAGWHRRAGRRLNLNPVPWMIHRLGLHTRLQRSLAALKKRTSTAVYFEMNPFFWIFRALFKMKLGLQIRELAQKRVILNLNPVLWVLQYLHAPNWSRGWVKSLKKRFNTTFCAAEWLLNQATKPLTVEVTLSKLRLPQWALRTIDGLTKPFGFTFNVFGFLDRAINRLMMPLYVELKLLRSIVPIRRSHRSLSRIGADLIFNFHHHSRRLAWAIRLRDMRWLRVKSIR